MPTAFTFQGQALVEGMMGSIPVVFQVFPSPEMSDEDLENAAKATGMVCLEEAVKRIEGLEWHPSEN